MPVCEGGEENRGGGCVRDGGDRKHKIQVLVWQKKTHADGWL